MAETADQPTVAAAEDQVVAEEHETNGIEPANGQEQGGAAITGEQGKAGGAEADEEPWRKRLWFVRMPRPPEAGAIKVMEQEVETYRAQFNLITEALNVKKMERDSAREATRTARESYNQCRAAFDERAKPVKALQEQRKKATDAATKLRDSFSDLLVKSEAELDGKLKELHYRIEHESITLNEEKAAMATIKKLEQQRERVRDYESSAATFAESKAKRSELQEALQEFDGELKALRQEMEVQRQIMDKLREHEKGIDTEVENVITERRRCRELMEQAYGRLNDQKKAQWEKSSAFYNNRRFSRDVRKLLDQGKLDEARQACAEQMDEAHELLSDNASFRAEYFALWEQQRKAPVVLPSAEDVDANLPPPSKAAKGGQRKGAAAAGAEPVDASKKAEATIAALLEQARESAKQARAAAAAAVTAEHDAAAAADTAAASAAAAAVQQQHQHEIVGLDEASEAAAPRAHPRPQKPHAPSRPVAEPVVVPEENFELPEAYKLKEKTPSSADLKELEREHNRQAQAESERRKAKKQQEKERKRQRQEQLAREAVEAAGRAAESAALAQTAAAAAVAAVNEDAAASDSDASEGGRAKGDSAAAAAAAGEQSSSGVPEQRKKGGGKAVPLPVAKALAPKPAAKRPATAKQGGLLKQAKKATKDYSVLLVGALLLIFAIALVMLFWTANSVAPQ